MSEEERAGLQLWQCTWVELSPQFSPHERGMGGKENINQPQSPVGYLEWTNSEMVNQMVLG